MKASPGKNIRSVLAAFVVAVALAGLACGTSTAPTPSAKGTPTGPAATATLQPTPAPKRGEIILRVAVPFISLPPAPPQAGGQSIRTGLAETLFKLNSNDLTSEPWLATGARRLDEKTWEVTLRQGVKFHNGALMDAVAVKASLERAIAKSPVAKTVLDIARIEVKDPSNLTIVTNQPSPILPALLAEPTSAILDAAAAEAMGDAFIERPVLTGPFKVERFQRDKELVVVRHAEYWGPAPLVDRVIFVYLTDGNSRSLALQSGDVDIASNMPPESVATVKNSPDLRVVSSRPVALEFMYFNHRREPWKDVRVRQAIAFAINREALVKAVREGVGTPANGPFPPILLRCDPLRGHPFDPVKARQLLTQAGYQDKDGDGYMEKDGQTLSMTLLTYRQNPELVPMAEIIQGSLKTIGIKVTVRLVEQIGAALQQGDWDGGLYFNNMVTTGDPYWALSQFYATGGATNFGGYSNPRIDELTHQIGQATDRQARLRLACVASQTIVDELPVLPLLYADFIYFISRKVVGLDDPHPFFLYFMDNTIGKR